jgi:hypothetical protein
MMDKMQFIVGPDSKLEAPLISAYLETNYGVGVGVFGGADLAIGFGDSPDGEFTLNVGTASTNLIALYKRHGVDCSAYITPCNPFSKSFSGLENETRLIALRTQLQRRSLRWLEGIGAHPDGQWAGEQSFLILGLSLESAKLLATEQDQNAFVWAHKDGIPKLVLLR